MTHPKFLVLPALLALCSILVVLPASADEPIRVTHRQGEIALAATPQRVAVFDLAALDILDALGVEAAGVPNVKLPPFLSRYDAPRYRRIGTLFEPDTAALTALAPNLIIVGGRSRSAQETLAATAPTIDLSTGTDHFVDDVAANAATLGRIFGKQAVAERRVAALRERIAALRRQAAGRGEALVLFAVGGGVSAQGPGERFGIVHELVGLPSTAPKADPADGGTRPAAGSPEAQARRTRQEARLTQALAADPDWLFVLDRDAMQGAPSTVAERLAQDARITATTAWKRDQVVYLDAPTWYLVGGGLTALDRSVEQFAAAFARTED